jgi:hypothetical protein
MKAYYFKRTVGCPIHGPFFRGAPMLQNEVLVEVLFVDLIHLGRVHEVNDLTDTVDG